MLLTTCAATDAELLEEFSRTRSEAAFTVLVERHGAMVMGVCRRVLLNAQDAEDAAQAVFLALAQKAGRIDARRPLAPWLYRVARQVALDARKLALRRRRHESLAAATAAPHPTDSRETLVAHLDAELETLPQKYRTVMVLYCLQGLSREQVARTLNDTEGAVASRLHRARSLLAQRLKRRAGSCDAEALSAVLAGACLRIEFPPTLLAPTAKFAALSAAGHSAVASTAVEVLAEGALKAMWWMKVKTAVAAAAVLLVAGVSMLQLTAADNAPVENIGGQIAGEKSSEPRGAEAKKVAVVTLYLIVADGKFGLIDETGKVIVAPVWSKIATRGQMAEFANGLAAVGNAEKKWGYIDATGKLVIACQFDEAREFAEGLAAVKVGKKFGYIDTTGHLSIPASFDDAAPFSEGLAAVEQDDKTGYINSVGKFVIAPTFYSGGPFKDGVAVTFMGNDRLRTRRAEARSGLPYAQVHIPDPTGGVIDKTGKYLSDSDYEWMGPLHGGRMGVMKAVTVNASQETRDKQYGYLDAKGNEIVAPKYLNAGEFSEDRAWVSVKFDEQTRPGGIAGIKSRWALIDAEGREILPPTYDVVEAFNEGLAAVAVVNAAGFQWGFVDNKGRQVIARSYEHAGSFHDGLASIRENSLYGYIDVKGDVKIAPRYFMATDFRNGVALVALDRNKWGIIDTSGKVLAAPQYFSLNHCGQLISGVLRQDDSDTRVWLSQDGKVLWSSKPVKRDAAPAERDSF